MKKISIIAAALALGVPATAYAAADCCKGMECCKNGAECYKDGKGDCRKDMRQSGDPAGHEMHGDHEGHAHRAAQVKTDGTIGTKPRPPARIFARARL